MDIHDDEYFGYELAGHLLNFSGRRTSLSELITMEEDLDLQRTELINILHEAVNSDSHDFLHILSGSMSFVFHCISLMLEDSKSELRQEVKEEAIELCRLITTDEQLKNAESFIEHFEVSS